MLEAFNIIELHCNCLIEHAKQLDKPNECGEDIREAAAGIIFAAGRCSDLPELLFARTILANKFGDDFATMAKEGTGVVDPMLVWKLSGNKTNMEVKKKVVKEIAAENNVSVDFSELQEVVEQDGSGNDPHHH
ncbi:Regulator of Vps4 activity in the MVB pathway protein [Zea mays]|nr:Regulator of Vps4 activity in the MVB pathway protein [Zea mays]